jgi:hypothetical protein
VGQRAVKFILSIIMFALLAACQQAATDDSAVKDKSEIKVTTTEDSDDIPDALKEEILDEQSLDPEQFLVTYPTRYVNAQAFTATWARAPKTKDYDVIIARDETCKIPVQLEGDLNDEEVAVNFLLEGDYYFCLYAIQEGSTILSAKNGPFLFTVDVTAPDDITMVDISANNFTSDTTPTISWNTVTNADAYDLIIASDDDCTIVVQSYPDLTVGEQLLSELEDGTYYACLTAKDFATNATTATNSPLTFVIDTVQPTVAGVSASSANGYYKIGSTVSLTVTFDDVVEVTNTGDLKLQLETGAVDREATYASGSGTSILVFTYTVQVGDETTDLDTKGASSLVLGTATIKDRALNTAVTTLPLSPAANTLAGSKALYVDGVVPTVASVDSSTGDGYYNTGDLLTFQVVLSEAVALTNTSQVKLKLETGATDALADYSTGSGTSTLVFTYTVASGATALDLATHADGIVLGTGTIKDLAGNAATLSLTVSPLSTNRDMIVDTDLPTPTPPAAPTDAGSYSTGTSLDFDWSASADGTTAVDSYYVQIGTTPGGSDVFAGNVGNVLTKNITGNDGSIYYARFKAIDDAGNESAYSSNSDGITVDTTAPAVPGTPTDNGAYDNATVTFNWTASSDATSGVASYFVEIGTTVAGNDIFSGSVGALLTKTVAGTTGVTYYARVKAIDNAGNESAYSGDSDGVIADATVPSVPGAPTDAGSYTSNATVTFNWTVSTDVDAGMASYYLQVGTSAGGNDVFDADVGNVLTYDIAGSTGVTYYARVRAYDAVGNASAFTANSNGIMVDTSNPSTPAAPSDAGVATNNTTVTFTWVAPGDTGSGVASYYVEVGTTAGGNDVFAGDVGNVLTKDITGINGETYYARVKAIDEASNNSSFSSNSNGILVDTDAPAAFSITGPSDPSYSSPVSVTFGASTGASNYDLIVSSVNDCNSPVHVASSPYTGITASQSVALADGVYYVCMTAKDAAANSVAASNNGYSFEVESSVLHASYTYYDSGTPIYELRHVKLQSGTATVTAVDDLVDPIKQRSSLALDAADKVHIAYQMYDGAFYDLYYAQNVGGAFAVELVDGGAANDDVGFANSIALESDDTVHMTHRYYFDDTVTPEERLTVSSGVTFGFTTEGTPLEAGGGRTFVDSSTVLSSGDVAHVVYTYYDGANYILGHRANNGGWGSGIDETIANPSCDDIEYASAAMDSANKLHIAYTCVTSGGACEVFHATNATGSWVHTDIGDIDTAGCSNAQVTELHRPTLAVDGSDYVHAAYFDSENSDLYYTENSSSSFVGAVVNAAAGWEPTLALDATGKAYIVYLDAGGGAANLKLSTNNSGSWVTTTLDASGKVTGVGDAAVNGVPGRSNR